MATIHVLPLRMSLFQNLKCQTGNSCLLWKLSEKNEQHKCPLHPKSYQALRCKTKSFTLKAYGYAELQSQKYQTGEKYFLFITLKTFGEEWTTQMSSSSKKLPGVNVRDQEFHVKSIWLCRASKSEMSNWRKVFSIYNSEDVGSRMNNKTFFFIEKSPSVNVREQKFHVKSIWSSR